MSVPCACQNWVRLARGLGPDALGQLMPMFLWLDPQGRISALGPALGKILGPGRILGSRFEQHFRLRCARAGRSGVASALDGRRRISLSLRARPEITLRGSVADVGLGAADGLLLNLSFGIHLAEAVREFGLTETDFAPSDMAMELLYLQEAKATVLNELRALTVRLEDARRSALSEAQTDPLTGVANRRAFDLALERLIRGLGRGGQSFALAHVDLDYFKSVNDTLGHAAGDQLLRNVARVLEEETRRSDLVARVGGDEFVLLLRGATDPERLQSLGARIIARLEEPYTYGEQTCRISASIGVALSPDYDEPTAEAMLADADAALYLSKRLGKGRCSLAAPQADAEGMRA
ncbi:GGDEF domain-containing protein [Sinirhodobacter sp. HNIBRBA609]|nr:GGDEF domain-containing protein [Sinirhodobacter sp. HNIBRBA609]